MAAFARSLFRAINGNTGDLRVSATQTVTDGTTGGWVDVGNASALYVSSIVTAASGTSPSLTVTLQTSIDQTDANAVAIPGGAFTAQTAVSVGFLKVTDFHRYVRATWTITGTTPSFTFAVSASTRD